MQSVASHGSNALHRDDRRQGHPARAGVNNHNLANADTTGFRADLAAFQSRAVDGAGFASRVDATNGTIGWDSQRAR